MRLPLSDNAYATLVSVYAPTITNHKKHKEAFYQQLDEVIRSVPAGDKLIILGDFNARVGSNHSMGWHYWSTWYQSWELEWQTSAFTMPPAQSLNHKHILPTEQLLQKHLDAPKIKPLASKLILSWAENMTCMIFTSSEQWEVLNVQQTILSSEQKQVVCWLLNVPATCKCISGTDLPRQFYVLPHWDRSCRFNSLSHPVTVYWHRTNQSQHWPYIARRLAG